MNVSISPAAPVAATSSAASDHGPARQIRWYRSPVTKEQLRALSRRSNLMGALQTGGYLGIYALTAGSAICAPHYLHWAVAPPLVFLHGMVAAFMINGVHELGHGTVFRTKSLNAIFVRVLAFLGWINFKTFGVSHSRHHAYTLHPPDDLEVVLPIRLARKHFFQQGFVNPVGMYHTLCDTWRIARGRFQGEWELKLFPACTHEKRRPAIRWARFLLIAHFAIACVSVAFGWWMVPIVITLAPFYGGWLFFLCNNTQHIGLRNNAPDFRLCCRTFTLTPLIRILYWQMNYHTEHHMYPTVPCYRLGQLHRAIRDDLPPCPRGLVATWREIASILAKQKEDPEYQHFAMIPIRPGPTGSF